MDTTLAHEWGHREDSPDGKGEDHSHTRLEGAMYDKGRMHVSPYMEGTADGYMERYSEPHSNIKWEGDPKGMRKAVGYNRRHEAVLDPAQREDRHLDLWRKTGELSGYGVDSKHWKNKQEMALYAAARLHVASGGKSAIDSLPNMTELAETHLRDYGSTLYKKDKDRVMKSEKGFARLPHDIPEYQNAAKHLYLGKLVHEKAENDPILHTNGNLINKIFEQEKKEKNQALIEIRRKREVKKLKMLVFKHHKIKPYLHMIIVYLQKFKVQRNNI
jgi:hypothetical protein